MRAVPRQTSSSQQVTLIAVSGLWAGLSWFCDKWGGGIHAAIPLEKGKRGKGGEMGLKTKQRQWCEEESKFTFRMQDNAI